MKRPSDVMVEESEFDNYGTVIVRTTNTSATPSFSYGHPSSATPPWCAGCGKVITERSVGAFTIYGMDGQGKRYCCNKCRVEQINDERQKMRGVI